MHSKLKTIGTYTVQVWEAINNLHAAQLGHRIETLKHMSKWSPHASLESVRDEFDALVQRFQNVPRRLAVERTFDNVVTTVGKNLILDSSLGGVNYTAGLYMGLISSQTSYVAPVATDTMASHPSWFEAVGTGVTYPPTFSQTSRAALTFGGAANGLKTSNAVSFNITGSGTLEGAFLCTDSTLGGTAGTLLSAGGFQGGSQAVVNGNIITVSYSLQLA